MRQYNKQAYSMLTTLLISRNIPGNKSDLWNVNIKRSCHEEFTNKAG